MCVLLCGYLKKASQVKRIANPWDSEATVILILVKQRGDRVKMGAGWRPGRTLRGSKEMAHRNTGISPDLCLTRVMGCCDEEGPVWGQKGQEGKLWWWLWGGHAVLTHEDGEIGLVHICWVPLRSWGQQNFLTEENKTRRHQEAGVIGLKHWKIFPGWLLGVIGMVKKKRMSTQYDGKVRQKGISMRYDGNSQEDEDIHALWWEWSGRRGCPRSMMKKSGRRGYPCSMMEIVRKKRLGGGDLKSWMKISFHEYCT